MKIAEDALQPKTFAFTKENLQEANKIMGHYPEGRQASALIPLLDLAQRQPQGWLPRAAIETVAGMLAVPPMRALEVASFYTMFNLEPVGKHLVQICTTTPCWLRGSDELVEVCHHNLRIRNGETTSDGMFTLKEVECLGACANAPMVQINDDYYEDLDAGSFGAILDALEGGATLKTGSVKGRKGSEPIDIDEKPYALDAFYKPDKKSAKSKKTPASKEKVIPLPKKEGD